MRKSPLQGACGASRTARRLVGVVLLVGAAVIFGQCNTGGGGGGGAFDVVSFSVSKQSARVYLNDSIEIEFNQPVDPKTAFSGIYIYPSASAGATRAQGELRTEGSRVIFTPTLPTDPQFTSGGLLPNTEYTICIPPPGGSCSVHIQNSPGVRTTSGRGLSQLRTESFLTVDVGSSKAPFRPEIAPQRPGILSASVIDASGVEQALNPIVNLISGQTWVAAVLTTVVSSPPTTVIPGTSTAVPHYRFEPTRVLNKVVTSPFDPRNSIVGRSPLSITLSNPSQPLVPDEFRNAGGVLIIRDSSTPPVTAAWAIASNTTNRIDTLLNSGPDYDALTFKTPPLVAEVSQGITRQVAPGDVTVATEIRIVFDEPLNPLSALLDNFRMWRVTDGPSGLEFAEVPPASTLKGSLRQGITHEVTNGRSIVTLRPKASFPQSKPNEPATIVVTLETAQPENSVSPSIKSTGLRDLNDFALAYPVRAGWVLQVDAGNNPSTVAYIDELPYRNALAFPKNIQIMWAFVTRADTEVTNAVVENFVDRQNVSPQCRTTAAWTKAGQAGLYATYGYGGSGAEGDVVVSGATKIDTSSLPLAADGVAEIDYNKLTISATGTITVEGPYPLRINALDSMVIEGVIDASGQNGNAAPSGKASAVGRLVGGKGGPGAGAGGDSNTNPLHSIGALPMEIRGGPGYPRVTLQCGDLNRSDNRLITVIEPNCGGGTGGNRGVPSGTLLRDGCSGNGGGHLQDGVQTDYLCSNIGAFGRDYGQKWVVPTGASAVPAPTGGTGGGAGGNTAISTSNPVPSDDVVAGSGGGGGGGIELCSAGSLDVRGSANIRAIGGNGGKGYTTIVSATTVSGGWGGGGSGGCVWLSGTSVTVDSGAKIDATGGTGNPTPPSSTRTGDGGDGYVIIRDRGDSPTVATGATITPAYIPERKLFAPTSNGKSEAYSAWYDSGEAAPAWAFDASSPLTGDVLTGKDLTWLTQPVQGQSVKIFFQGSPDDGGKPNANPATWYPAGNTAAEPCKVWDPDITKLRNQGNLRHIRFKVMFDVGVRNEGVNPPNQIAIQRIIINYQKPKD